MVFQETIRALEDFWAKYGCVIEQPYDGEVEAGTLHPATFLRALGPEPWSAAYVQPSRRPADSRYAENPYRLYRHHQFQVILKPSPDDVQDVYLASLRALGFDPRHHDIRFIEDDWESPALGASGVGWQVRLNGVGISQFTYFQALGGVELNPVSVELTYGLERICMAEQHVEHFGDLTWGANLTYGDIRRQSEIEWSDYTFEFADPDAIHRLFDLCEQQASSLLDSENVLPAYGFITKCAHAVNVLDARGSLTSITRRELLSRVHALFCRCATVYVQRREKLGFPLLAKTP